MANNKETLNLGRQIQMGKGKTLTTQIDLSNLGEGYEKFIGKFTFHYPTLMERMRIGVIKANFLGNTPAGTVDMLTDNIAHMTATLSVVVDNAPDWFKLDFLEDYDVLESIYDKYFEWYSSFRNKSAGSDNQGDSQES